MNPPRLIDTHTRRVTRPLRVGLFGLLGVGNLGNDGSLDAALAYLRARHPGAMLDARCGGPEQVTARHDIPATPLHWNRWEFTTANRPGTIVLKAAGKAIDAVRTLAWVRKHDVVIVPGMGVLEATLPLRPWGFPYTLFLLCATARLAGTKVALISVGADTVQQPVTRWLVARTARLAHYRSYRDTLSRDAMRAMGVDTSADAVYPDLAFALPEPDTSPCLPGAVGVGLMDYRGGNGERRRADEIRASYLQKMKSFVRWLVDTGRPVRLFTGDDLDEAVVAEILADIRAQRPQLDASCVAAEPARTLPELMRQMSAVETVVATRYHNVLCALKLNKPTVSIGYAAKNDVLMQQMGLADFCQSARSLDIDRLKHQVMAADSERSRIQHMLTERNTAIRDRLEHQFSVLSATLLAGDGSRFPAR